MLCAQMRTVGQRKGSFDFEFPPKKKGQIIDINKRMVLAAQTLGGGDGYHR